MRTALLVSVSMMLASPALAQSVRDIASRGACSTAGVEGISRQLIETQRCMGGGGFVRFDDHPNIRVTSSRVHPFVQRSARDALHRAADRVRLDVNSAFRPLAEQYVLYHSGGCAAAASPGASNHQSGRAVDLANWSGAKSAMGNAGCAWLGSWDAVHFDCPGGDRRSDSVRAFQRLWNMNHPGDRIAEDGVYGAGTASRLGRSPARGFAQSGCCVARCDGDVVVRADCTRHTCGEHATCAMDGGPRCVDTECPSDGARATLCAESGELLICEDRRGSRLTCGEGDVCTGGACVVEACAGFEGATCLDASTLGECEGGALRSASPCADGCVEDASGARCQAQGACAGADGAVCLDASTLGQCSGGVLLGTETCETGCTSGAGVGAMCASATESDAGVPVASDGGAHTMTGGCSASGAPGGSSVLALLVLAGVLLSFRRRGALCSLLIALTATGCASEPLPSDLGVAQADLTSSQRRARARVIRDVAAENGLTQGWLIAGVADAETGMAHCWREATWACQGPSSSDCGGGPVIAGSADGPCSLHQGGLGMFQFDAGTFSQTLAREGRRILSLRGNIDAGIDFIVAMVIRSPYISGVDNRAEAIRWMNGVRVDNGRFPSWVKTVTHLYNGCAPSYSCYPQRYAHYRDNARGVRSEMGADFWQVCEAHCEGETLVRRDCSRHTCEGASVCGATSDGARCVDPECPADGSVATLCASDGQLLLCDQRRGERIGCGAGDVCEGGACNVEACAGAEGPVCLDASTLGECSGGTLIAAAPCAAGCSEEEGGARCASGLPCEGVEGATCLDESTLAECASGAVVSSELCAEGCVSGACVAPSESDAELVVPDGGASRAPIGPSGCSAGGAGRVAWWVVLGVLALVIGRRRSMKTVMLVVLALAWSAPSGARAQPADCRDRTLFAEGELGDRAAWTERTPQRWCVMRRGEEFRYALHATGFSSREGLRLGEQSVFGDALGDVELTVRARTLEDVSANTSADYGLILGWQSASDYYLALVHPVAESCGIFVVKGGVREKLAACSSPLGLDELLHDVSFRRRTVEGGAQWLELTFDGRLVAYASHAEGPLGPGKVGIGSMNDAALFDDPTVAPYPRAVIEEDAATPIADAGLPADPPDDAAIIAPDAGPMTIAGGCQIGASPSAASIASGLLVLAMLWRACRRA